MTPHIDVSSSRVRIDDGHPGRVPQQEWSARQEASLGGEWEQGGEMEGGSTDYQFYHRLPGTVNWGEGGGISEKKVVELLIIDFYTFFFVSQ